MSPASASPDLQTSRKSLALFQGADNGRASGEVLLTASLFLALWTAMAVLMTVSAWLVLALIVPASFMLVRLFMVQHDCGHGAMFTSRAANDWVGRALGLLTLTPYDYWRRAHGIHHASSGHLDKRGVGDITTLTVKEYRALPARKRLAYRLYRHPLVMFVVGPAWLFLVQHRLPVGAMHAGAMPWTSTMLTNLGIAVLVAGLVWAVGPMTVLAVHLPVVLIASTIGVWMFYVQHQFEETAWDHEGEWSHQHAALHGSSYYDLPRPLMWLTGNIGIHHLHHLNSRIPYYRLQAALDAHRDLGADSRLTFRDSLKCVRLSLWDEEKRRLVSFAEAAKAA